MRKICFFILTMGVLGFTSAFAEDGHNHESHKGKEDHQKHKEGNGHDHSEEGHSDHDNLKDHEGHEDHKEKNSHKGHDNHKGKESHKDHDNHKEGEDGHDHGGGKAIGKGKAITDVNEKKGFKLSKEAIKSLMIKLNTVDGSTFNIDKKTLVVSKNKKGVYRFRAGYFKFLPAKILKEETNGYRVKVTGVDFGDQIVVNGVGLLRVTDVYSTDKSEYGHSH